MKIRYLLLLLACTLIISCKTDPKKTEAEELLNKWMGKTILFPENATCFSVGGDSICPEFNSRPFKVLLYVDSTGCTPCKSKLFDWNRLIAETDSIMPDKVNFLFFFQSKNADREFYYLLMRDDFYYPVYIDKTNRIDRLNRFPTDERYQCFLLDKDNKVLSIGNPTLNHKVWDLYKKKIMGGNKLTE
ncbi:hypothetical protein [Viscerimonas tarda]